MTAKKPEELSPNEKIPKVDLHRHLELSLRPDTIWELAPQFGITLKSQQDFQDRFMILEPMKDLGSVLNKFLDTQKLLASVDILERISYEACVDAYNKEGVRILELRYAPTFIQQGHSLTFEQIHEAIVAGIQRAEVEYPIAVGLICIIQRILPVKDAERVVDFAIANKDSFIGLDLADNEEGFDSKPFASSFLRAKKAGLGITIHSGEAANPKAPEWIMDALDVMGADRIGHGVQIYRDENVMRTVRDRKIVLELCPTSNLLTQAVAHLKFHPLKQLTDFGILTTINTDDPGIFNTNMNREFRIARETIGMTQEDLEKCSQTGAENSFIPLAKRQKAWPKKLV
jgi:adenosine deaminase